MCLRMKLKIKGVDFPTNIIVLESKGIDVILGMDWLTKYDGVIECARRAVRLTNGDGTKVEFVATIPTVVDCSLNLWKMHQLIRSEWIASFLMFSLMN